MIVARGPRVLVLDSRNHRRLAVVDRLRAGFRPESLPPGADPLRHVRGNPPDLVLIFVHPWRPTRAFRICRWLKTDLRPVERVAVVNVDGPVLPPERVLEHDLADGYWQGAGTPEEWAEFAEDCLAGRRPVVVRPRPRGAMLRLIPW